MSESYWQRLIREAEERRHAKEAEERAERARRIFDDVIRFDAYRAVCPCCQGTGRVGIIIGAKDDA